MPIYQATFRSLTCYRRGIKIGTIDALIARLVIRHELTLLTTDRDFERLARLAPLELWRPAGR